MSSKIKSLLLPFYFGAIRDDERILVERELLVDSEVLLDYLDLKRSIENAELIPSTPSIALWQVLREKVGTRRKLFLSLSVGMAAVFVLAMTLFLFKKEFQEVAPQSSGQNELLFDSISEPSSNLNVL